MICLFTYKSAICNPCLRGVARQGPICNGANTSWPIVHSSGGSAINNEL